MSQSNSTNPRFAIVLLAIVMALGGLAVLSADRLGVSAALAPDPGSSPGDATTIAAAVAASAVLNPVADARVSQGSPGQNYGANPQLVVA